MKLKEITTFILDRMYQKLSIGDNGEKLSYNSQYAYYKLLNAMFNQAVRWNLLDRNPNTNARKPKKEKIEKKFYDNNQVNAMLKALEKENNYKYKALIILALDSGARRAEICALRWKDLDFTTKSLSITKSLKVVNGIVDEKNPKTESSNRTIVLSSKTIEVLKEYKEWQDYYKKYAKEWIETDRIFTSVNGDYMHPDTCDHILKKIITRHNLEPITFHGLRHTSASLLINANINPKTVSERLGHSSSDITMNIYTHSFEQSKNECSDVLNNMLKIA